MLNFEYHIPTEIIFGKSQINKLASRLDSYNNILLVWGGGSIKRIGLYDEVMEALSGKTYHELSGIKPNPRITSVKRGIKMCRENHVDFILAAGGGSVIDCAKAIAAGVYYPGDVWDLFLRKSSIKRALPVGAVLTLAASASEINRSAVITNQETNQKLSITSNLLRPIFSILDPTYTMSVPKNHTAAGIVDIMSHVFEHYFDPTKGTYLQDRLAEGLLKTCIHYGPKVLENPDNYEGRANIMWAGSLALGSLISYGKQGDFATHKIAHEVGAAYDLAHGICIAILLPNWMKYVMSEDMDKFVELARNVWGLPQHPEKKDMANSAILKTREFFCALGMPEAFSEVNIDEEKFEDIAERAVYFGEIGSFRKLKKEDILAILRLSA